MTQILNENEDNKLKMFLIHEAYLHTEHPHKFGIEFKTKFVSSLHSLKIDTPFAHASNNKHPFTKEHHLTAT